MTHLTPAERDILSSQLDAMKRQVLDEIRSAGLNDDTAAQVADHEVSTFAEQAGAAQLDEVRFAEMEVDRARLRHIEQAQQRLRDGRYGLCVDCGAEIPRERLLAQPIAIRCTACQIAMEQQHRD